jgi:2-polyprenyl-3-methyl-5-hydroxy-6-metoxy-1,4-benzoquinol methylase
LWIGEDGSKYRAIGTCWRSSAIADNPTKADIACWICGSRKTAHWKARNLPRSLIPKDLEITDRRYGVTLALWKCRDCGFIFAHDEELNQLTSLYERLSDVDYVNSREPRLFQMRWLLETAQKVNPKAVSLLDVGAGAGLLVAEAKRLGLEATGVEPCRAFVDSARVLYGVEILHGVLPHPELANRQFDLVFLVDVIEHVSDPVKLLRQSARLLSSGGLLVVVTPDVGSLPAKILGPRWWHFRVAHVGYFDRTSLRKAIKAVGLVAVYESRAKWFFSVRYLAERLAVYLPIHWLNRIASRVQLLRWCYDRAAPLNLHDSFLVFLQRAE